MPTKRRRVSRGFRTDRLTDEVRTYLESGERSTRGRFGLASGVPTTPEGWRALWLDVQDEVLDDWTEREPGTRPHGWWHLDDRELRRVVAGTARPIHPAHHDLGVPLHWEHVTPGEAVAVESEARFLARTRQLLRGERARLTADDFAPEPVRIVCRRLPSAAHGGRVASFWFTTDDPKDTSDVEGECYWDQRPDDVARIMADHAAARVRSLVEPAVLAACVRPEQGEKQPSIEHSHEVDHG